MITFRDEPAPQATLIVVGLRDAPLLGACLESVAALVTGVTYEVIIVLNDPTTERAADIECQVRGAQVVSFGANLGFGGAVTVAAERARGEHLVLLNDDCTVTPGWLDALVDTAQRHAACAAVGSTIVSPEGLLQEAGAVIWADGVTWHVGEGLEVGFMGFERRVDYCSGGSLLIRKEVWDGLGGFDPAYFPAYYEDVDFCLRAAEAGWEVWYQPRSLVRHARSRSTEPVFRHFLWERAHATFLRRWREVLLDRAPSGALELAVWKGMGSPTRVLVITNDLRESCEFLGEVARERGLHASVFAIEPRGPWAAVPAAVRVITDLGSHLATAGVDYDVVVAPRPLPDSLCALLRDALPHAPVLAGARTDAWSAVVRTAREDSPPPEPRIRDPQSRPQLEMTPQRQRDLEVVAQRRELEVMSAYAATLQEHLAAERARGEAQADAAAQSLADLTRERDELQRDLEAERGRISYRLAQPVASRLKWARALKLRRRIAGGDTSHTVE